MNFFEYQARKLLPKPGRKVRPGTPSARPAPRPLSTIPVVNLDELAARPPPIEVEETSLSDTFVGRLRADLRKLWGKE